MKKLTAMFSKFVTLEFQQKEDAKVSKNKEQWNNDRSHVLGNDKVGIEEQEQMVETYRAMQARFTKEVQGDEQTSEMGISMRYLQELVF